MNIVQVRLLNEDRESLVTWVDQRDNLKVGSAITLKDYKPTTKWIVMEMFDVVKDAKDFDWHRKWTNNI